MAPRDTGTVGAGRRAGGRARRDEIAARAEERFTVPVVAAALASVPATFLTMMEGSAATLGSVLNYATLAVFASESVVLFVLAGDRLGWLRRHRLPVILTLATVPAVLLALGPVQALRLLRFVRVLGALRIIRVARIVRAGRVLRQRAGLEGLPARVAVGTASLLAAVFVALVLADPSSATRRFLDSTLGDYGPAGVVAVLVAGALLAAATFVVVRNRGNPGGRG